MLELRPKYLIDESCILKIGEITYLRRNFSEQLGLNVMYSRPRLAALSASRRGVHDSLHVSIDRAVVTPPAAVPLTFSGQFPLGAAAALAPCCADAVTGSGSLRPARRVPPPAVGEELSSGGP